MNYNTIDNEINIRELFSVLWNKKLFIISTSLIFALISVIYALSLPNKYTSNAVLIPQNDQSQMNGSLNQYSSMAALAGFALPSESTRSQEAIAIMKSYKFFSNNFLPNIALENLLAADKWDPYTNSITYDKNIYNQASNKWEKKDALSQLSKPSNQQAYEAYKTLISISEDKSKKTDFVTLSISHISPYIAKKWVQLIIDEIDSSMRDQEREEASRSVNYLNSLAPTVNYEIIKNAISSLQQDQMKRLMIISANENYVFKVLESPIVPEKKSDPRRSLIVIIFTFLGGMISTIIVLGVHFTKESDAH